MILQTEKDMENIRGTVFSHPATKWDPKLGYKWNKQKNRVLRVAHGEIVADHEYKFNNYHQHCSFDYSPKKRAKNIYRFVVLGDSFTNDLMLHTAWPETLHHLLNSRKEFKNDFEVYSFPTDGGGLVNWHATFNELIEPEFEYDALIIADWGDDLERPWIISDWRDGKLWIIRMEPDSIPHTRAEVEKIRSNGFVIAKLCSAKEIEAFVKKLKQNANPAPLKPEDYPPNKHHVVRRVPGDYEFSRDAFVKRYGQLRYDMLSEIVATCHNKHKTIIYSTLPTREGLIHLHNGGEKLFPQLQGEWLSKHFGIHFFDGFEAFNGIDNQSLIDFYWLKYDGHWNLGAATHYALKLAEWILREEDGEKAIADLSCKK